jgi:hypothetical protein
MTRLGLISTFALGLTLACSGTSQGDAASASAPPAPPPVRTVAEDRDLRMLFVDLAAQRACEHVAGEFLGLSGTEQQSASSEQTKQDAAEPKQGRLWIERCRAEREGDEVAFELSGRGWRWVDRESKRLGAKFKVSQYVRFDAEIQARGTVDLSYARSRKILTLMMSATEPVRAKLTPISQIDAEAKGGWAWLLGAASSTIGKSPDRQAAKKFGSQGSQRMAERMTQGYTVAIDLCSGQKYETLGRLAEGELPAAALQSPGRVWKENERIELMQGGVDLSGPYKHDDLPITFELEVEEGDPVVSEVVCTTEAQRIANAFLAGKRVPEVESLASELIVPGNRKQLRVEAASCDVVLYTRPSGKHAKLAHLAHFDRKTARPFVPCDEP